jgi:adenylate cyclase
MLPVDDLRAGEPKPDPASGHRRTAAILAADVVGYVRLMEVDETGTHTRLMQLRTLVLEPEIKSRGGRIVKHTGDGFMAMFESAAAALHSAKTMQAAVMASEAAVPADRRVAFRMGLNVSDVIVEVEDVYGDGVNIAARLQTHAEPGGIVISEIVAQQAGSLLGLQSIDLGQMHLRNHANPVRVLSLRLPGTAVAAFGDTAPGVDSRPSIAVLPFRKFAESGDSYFADGFVDNIIHALAGLKELFVISRGSTLGYRGALIDARAIGRELGVRYVLYGSVQRSGGRIRVTTELSDAETGEVIRPDHYDGNINDIFAFQDRIAEEVVKTIAPRVRDRELKRALRKHPQNMTAYELVLEALEPLYRLDYASFARARGLLQRAMTIDPSYAPAYSYAAYWHIFRIGQEWSTDFKSDVSEAARLSEVAIASDGNDATALAIYGYVQGYLKKDFNEALKFINRAIATSPSCSTAYTFSGATFCFLGDGPTSVRHSIEGLRISPLDTHVSFAEHILAQAHYVNGNLDEAIAWATRADKHNARLTSNLRTLIASYAANGRLEEARSVVRRHAEIVPAFRVSAWAARTPMQGAIRSNRIKELLAAGMPD